uniref:Glycosyltransferase family 92 protein n=1 Tax=Romanomermis culicivorax TaxID=13658 RepID=A0A915JCT4_ROMCU
MAGHFYSPKTITKPETVLKRWIHFVSNHIKGTGIYHLTENEGFLRHFKVRTWWGGWADNADQEVKYHMVDPQVEIGNSTLIYLMGQISDVAAQCKLAKTN